MLPHPLLISAQGIVRIIGVRVGLSVTEEGLRGEIMSWATLENWLWALARQVLGSRIRVLVYSVKDSVSLTSCLFTCP